ncbi:MAG: hypothetical protein ABI721_01675 [Candidatus Dojkabacteria bacterium]
MEKFNIEQLQTESPALWQDITRVYPLEVLPETFNELEVRFLKILYKGVKLETSGLFGKIGNLMGSKNPTEMVLTDSEQREIIEVCHYIFITTEGHESLNKIFKFVESADRTVILENFIEFISKNTEFLNLAIDKEFFNPESNLTPDEAGNRNTEYLASVVYNGLEGDDNPVKDFLRNTIMVSFVNRLLTDSVEKGLGFTYVLRLMFSASFRGKLKNKWYIIEAVIRPFLEKHSEVIISENRELFEGAKRGIEKFSNFSINTNIFDTKDYDKFQAGIENFKLSEVPPALMGMIHNVEVLATLREYFGRNFHIYEEILLKSGFDTEGYPQDPKFTRDFVKAIHLISKIADVQESHGVPTNYLQALIRRKGFFSYLDHILRSDVTLYNEFQKTMYDNAQGSDAKAALTVENVTYFMSKLADKYKKTDAIVGKVLINKRLEQGLMSTLSEVIAVGTTQLDKLEDENKLLFRNLDLQQRLVLTASGERFTLDENNGKNIQLKKYGIKDLVIKKTFDGFRILITPISEVNLFQGINLLYNVKTRTFSLQEKSERFNAQLTEWQKLGLENLVLKHIEFVASGRALGDISIDPEILASDDRKSQIIKRHGYWRRLDRTKYPLKSAGAIQHQKSSLDEYDVDIIAYNQRRWEARLQNPDEILTFVKPIDKEHSLATEWDYFEARQMNEM